MSVFTGSRLSRCRRSAGMTSSYLFESKGNRPLFAALGQGVARSSLFRLPRDRGGWRADKALPGLLQAWNGLGVKRHAPRLAARQRGILAFMPLTVVGP